MSITIGSNIDSISAQRSLANASDALSRVYERLASGQRINRAADDAAGMAVAASLNADARIFNRGLLNVNDGLSALNIAEGAAMSMRDILIRQKELAEQSANGIFSSAQRTALNNEYQALTTEYNRILETTTFNDMALFGNGGSELAIQAARSVLQLSIGSKLAATSAVGTGAFTQSGTFPSGYGAETNTVNAGDFNGDGKIDLIGNARASGITISLGNGDGSFNAPTLIPHGLNSGVDTELTIGDINGDSKLDIIIPANYSGYIAVMLGNGNGTFRAPITNVDGPIFSSSPTLADFNGDGRMDVFVTERGTTQGTIYLGNGDGSLNAPAHYNIAVGGGTFESVAGDLNGDGKIDLLTTNALDAVYVEFGNGNGSFNAPVGYDLSSLSGSGTESIALADFNGDGSLDFLFGDLDGQVGIFLNNGDGTFRKGGYSPTPAANLQMSVLAADLNGDGKVDAAMTTTNGVAILLGNGDGTLRAAVTYGNGSLGDLTIADVTGDGVMDLIGYNKTTYRFQIYSAITSGSSSLQGGNILTQSSALAALDSTDAALLRVTQELAVLGANQSRLGVAASHLQSSSQEYQAAASRIIDTDIGQEAASLAGVKILQQASTAVLAQANQQPALALRLLAP